MHHSVSTLCCDILQECTNLCCIASTCQLASNAQCSTGLCCNSRTCQLQSYGTMCRVSTGSCDIEEYCSGESHDCPVDTHLRDGSTCNNGSDYCFNGTCQTLDSQCQLHFSEWHTCLSIVNNYYILLTDSSNGDSECYSQLNIVGDNSGNCGYNETHYIPCSPR